MASQRLRATLAEVVERNALVLQVPPKGSRGGRDAVKTDGAITGNAKRSGAALMRKSFKLP